MCVLGGCAEQQPQIEDTDIEENVQAGYVGMAGDRAQIQYQVSRMRPSVLTDQIGYETGSTKLAFFIDGQNGQTFEVINAETGETVYSGKMEYAGRDEQTQRAVCYGTFTEMVEEGRYYIRAGALGESYSFSVGSALYGDLFRQLCASYEQLWHPGVYEPEYLIEDARTISNLLIAYEYYTGVFGDDTGCRYSGNTIPDLIELVAQRVEQIITLDIDTLSWEELGAYAGILAKFSQDYKAVDADLSAQCLTAAQDGYEKLLQVGRNAGDLAADRDESMSFYAAAELFRATGYARYHTVVKEYLAEAAESVPDSHGESMEFYGKVAYLSAKYRVDTALCSRVISAVMSEVEVLAAAYNGQVYLAAAEHPDGLCGDMVKFAIVNYVITNQEYVTVQENQLHYLLGRNPKGESYLPAGAYLAEEMLTDDGEQVSALILLMCEIMKAETEETN
ncbi:MAG: glycoside hydrolase family 9 protein [bacterium]|nr:glycoside hydrolase family 9 protein [bacterium]